MTDRVRPLAPGLIAAVCLACALSSTATQAKPEATRSPSVAVPDIDVPFTKYVLPNGLTLIVHEDHTVPLVAVNIWYHVGSKNEPKGRSGFAHLFEHLMFNGSEHYDDDFFKLTQKIGASDQNGTTSEDRTNYFQTVPKGALDTILWLESDRMGHLLGAIDQAKLDEQRKVVQNERRQNVDNRPYGKAEELVIRATMPVGHPYDHSVIGSMEDLNAASLEDVKEWFRTYYGPTNAVLVLAGDTTPEEAKAKVEKYFGDIQPGTPVAHPQAWVVRRTGTQRETAYDRVAQPMLIRVWNVSEYTSPDTDYLQFLGLVLAGDRNARLYKRLVMDEQLATSVRADVYNREIAGQFRISVTAKSDKTLPAIEKIVEQELRELVATGPTTAEMSRLRMSTIAGIIRGLEPLGGFGGRANVLAESETFFGSPDGWKLSFERFKSATPANLQAVAKRWLTDGDYVLTVLPFGELSASQQGADRKFPPMPSELAPATFPPVERGTLANGMKLVVAHRPGVPLVNLTLLLDTGTAEDFASVAPGTTELAMSMLEEGTQKRTGPEVIEALSLLGATVRSGGTGEYGAVSLSTLTSTLVPALALYAEVITQPSFPQKSLDRLKAQTTSSIAARKRDTGGSVSRLTPRLVFGADNAYGRIATPDSVGSIGRAQLGSFHDRWFRPNNATLIVAGDTTLARVKPLIEKAFGGWKPSPVPKTMAPLVAGPAKPVVYLLDHPGTPQTMIRAALVAPAQGQGDEIALQVLNNALGGTFTSRLNMKLREEKGWAYGASSVIGGGGRGSRLFFASASVQTDKAAESMTEIDSVLKSIVTDRKVTSGELSTVKDNMTLGLSSAWSTSAGVAQYLMEQAYNRLPGDYYSHYATSIAAKSEEDIHAAATDLLGTRALTWVVAGDLSKIEERVRKLGLGEVKVIDADGKEIR
jgi:zinc protease